MITSIRRFLLINLLLAITITTSLTALGNFYLDQQDIHDHLDTILEETALTLHALLTHHLNQNNAHELQKDLNKINYQSTVLSRFLGSEKLTTKRLSSKYQFQVWDNKDNLLLYSLKAPEKSLIGNENGLSDKKIDGVTWRIYTIKDQEAKLNFVVAEKYNIRNRLARLITEDDIYIMLLTYPLSGLLIWIIIGKGLGSLKRVATEVAHRAPAYLDPVGQENVPDEIQPLVAELNKLFIRLQEAFEREQRFAADAAHELRTPLAAIRTQAQIAQKATKSDERQKMLENVINGVDRGVHIVQQLLTLSRLTPETGVLDDIMPLNLKKLSTDIIAQLAPVAIEKNINIEFICHKSTIKIVGNQTALSILLRNLIDNAIRYTPENGSVTVCIETNESQVILNVIDNGPGIPEELRARVFERFYRILGNTSPGSGLGLAIVQKIALLHNAEITLNLPATGKGLQVSVVFEKIA